MLWFRRRNERVEESLVSERWSTSFKWYQPKRLPAEDTPAYKAQVRQGSFLLEIKRHDCFAWVTSPFKYRDFELEATLQMDPQNGHCAAGFVLRYINEENFYYFLVSNHGYFRFDVLFNKNPIHLIEWTPCPLLQARQVEIRVIARGEGFYFYADDEWIGETDDATIPEGSCGFAAQNYSEAPLARFRLLSLAVESRPVEVEKAYLRWAHFIPARREHRIALAQTFFGMGRYLAAAVELKKAFRQGPGTAQEYRLQADVCLNLKLYDEALEALEKSLASAPENKEAPLKKADALFLANRFLRARDFIVSILPRFADNPWLHNLLGTCEYSLGNWDKALAACLRASALSPDTALYHTNLGRAQERLGLRSEALQTYLQAARLLFQQESYDELSLVLSRTKKIAAELQAAEERELAALEAKMLFHEGQQEEADRLFRRLIQAGYEEAAVHYLHALTLIRKDRRQEAEAFLGRAVQLEPGFSLYWFRLAENRFLQGLDQAEALQRALELAPDDPWINNLRGQVLMKDGQHEAAAESFRKAKEKAPAEADIYRNYASVLLKLGRTEEAVRLATAGLEAAGEKPELYNLRGNCRTELKGFAAALADYEKALELDADNPDYLSNCAACCLELDMILRAEELLNRLLDLAPSASAYNLTGNLAVIKGERRRAELAYLEALNLEPDNPEIVLNLISLYLEQGQYAQAKERLERVLRKAPDLPKALELQGRMREKFERLLSCAGCGRQWWVRKEVPPQSAFKIRGEPPGEAPAGKCGRCGKIWCIRCASEHVLEGQLRCPECGERLRLNDDTLKYLFLSYLEPSPQL